MIIVIEGPDGVGKDTVAESLSKLLTGEGYSVCIASEPSMQSTGTTLRELVLTPSTDFKTTPMLDALLFMTARRENYERFIPELLTRHDVVIVTRNWMSLHCYQLWELNENLDRLNRTLVDDLVKPEQIVQVLLYCELEVAVERMSSRGTLDSIESRGMAYLTKVNARYAELIGEADINVVDAKQSKEDVLKDTYEIVKKRMLK